MNTHNTTEWTHVQPDAPGEYWAVINWVVLRVCIEVSNGALYARDVDGAYYIRERRIPIGSFSFWCKSDTKPGMPKAGWSNA